MSEVKNEVRVLIVDDEAVDRKKYRAYLNKDTSQNYVFCEADSGAKALELVKEFKPHCIILDYMLPDLTGIDLIPKLQALNFDLNAPAAAIVMVSGYENNELALSAFRSGALDYSTKKEINAESINKIVQASIKKSTYSSNNIQLDNRLSKISSDISSINVTIGKQHVSLEEHIRRTNLLEEKIIPLEEKQSEMRGIIKLAGFFMGAITAIAAVIDVIERIRK